MTLNPWRPLCPAALAGLALLASGCVTETRVIRPGDGTVTVTRNPDSGTPAGRDREQRRPGTSPPVPHKPVTPADPAEVCENRLQDVCGLMLNYLIIHRQFPETLEELRTLADLDVSVNFTCPTSGQPYVYNPLGLQPPGGGGKRLILYDASPAHNGFRLGVELLPARDLGVIDGRHRERALSLSVVTLSEKDFRRYTPAPPPPPPATEPAATQP